MNKRVLIVGAGPGGLVAGVALRRAGFEPLVLERSPELREVGAGVTLWPNAVKVLRRLGVGGAVEADGVPVDEWVVRTWRGEPLAPLVAGDLERLLGAPLLVVHRACLQDTLRAALGAEALLVGSECVAIEQDDAGVAVVLRDGRREAGAVVIGADGLRSTVRALLFDDRPPRYSGLTAWRGIVPLDPLLAEGLGTGESWGPGAVFGTAPLGGSQVYWWASARERNRPARGPEEEKAAVRHRYRGWHAPVADLVDATVAEAIVRTPLYERAPLRGWARDRVALLGDAAHPMLPDLGQGACQAMEDGVALAEALLRTPDPVAALEEYGELRRHQAAFVTSQARRLARAAHLRNPVAVRVRDLRLRRVSPAAAVNRLARVVGDAVSEPVPT